MGTFSVTQETSLRSLHYMIANRFFPCNETLHIWYPNQSKLCTHCNIADTIVHYFVECLHVENFWRNFILWMANITGVHIQLGSLQLLLGILNPNKDLVIDCYNYCILLAKDFIYCQKKDDRECFLSVSKCTKNRLEGEKYRFH